jgi:hypothetical protein
MRGAEYAMLVTVKGDRLAPFREIRLGGIEVVEGVLQSGKAQTQQFARGVIDINEQGALRTAIVRIRRLLGRPRFLDASPFAPSRS